MRRLIVSLFATAAVVAAPNALSQAGRPPPITSGTPTPSPTPAPIKIGKPAASSAGTQSLAGTDMNKMIDAGLKLPLNPTTFSWSAGMGSVLMEKAATHICLLTEVTGNFAGAGEHIVLRVNQTAPGGWTWELSGTSGQPQLRATATCAKKDRFTPGMFSLSNVGAAFPPLSVETGCGPMVRASGMNGDGNAFFVREMVGKFRGGGESLTVVPNGTTSQGLRIGACSGNAGGALVGITMQKGGATGKDPTAMAGFGGALKYQGPGGRTVQTANATWVISDSMGESSLFGGATFRAASTVNPLIPVNQGLCGIVMVGGKFQGYGERVAVKQSGGNWVPDVSTIAEGSSIYAAFRCIARDQR